MFLKDQTYLGIKQKNNKLEAQFEVDKWKVNGIYVWPYSYKIIFLLLTNSNSESEDTKYEFDLKKKASRALLKLKYFRD
jgi:hypothetical protein